jgi:hypothetical protein
VSIAAVVVVVRVIREEHPVPVDQPVEVRLIYQAMA